ncbi:tetratricopeptide repeat protein, partial [Candidatus Amoebophilus asiaticus]|nr:tetratricopeptide repeat protein [Candidatus Amoebophilus asiaticus]
ISYLKSGEYENAIEYLEDFTSSDKMVSIIATGAIGDAYMEMNEVDKAFDYYTEASSMNENKFTTPLFLMKAALAQEELGNYAEAVVLYEKVKEDYGETTHGREIDKYIARARYSI